MKGQDQVATDQFFHDDPDEIEDDQGGTRTPRRPRPGSKNLNHSSINSSIRLTTPQTKISKYFPGQDSDDDNGNPNRIDVVMKAMKKEWWYDMFEVDRAQFDVSRIREKEKSAFVRPVDRTIGQIRIISCDSP